MKHWLLKSEPEAFSLQDLKNGSDSTTSWDGVRNYQARNFMRDEMRIGDRVLFYHSNTKPPGVVGTARVVREAYPDHTAWDPESNYFDPRSTEENPVWMMVDVQFESEFPEVISLDRLREEPDLKDMLLLRKGSRLSVMPVSETEFRTILILAGQA